MIRPDDLDSLLARLLAEWENECVEFKDANDNFSTSEIGKYFSALSNEANLRERDAGWLIFGVDNKSRGYRHRLPEAARTPERAQEPDCAEH
ncbi:MAG: putative DNA binding domain-containing protein [Rhodocyclaceae bacterium]|nr:putative DNA binding domain-containing protein [Rhodocyclaceae bacterium]MBX3667886.1 putative DNA binding domain-containing protein [Rhodocyclaceae bacterium]